jgi:tetrahydromethanopterin S-methyltransferase subunit D
MVELESTLLFLHQTGQYNTIEGIIFGIGTAFCIFMLVLSLSAYRKTNVQKIKYAITAFGLFAVFLLYESIEKFFKPKFTAYTDIFIAPIVLAIVVLFFFAIMKKR